MDYPLIRHGTDWLVESGAGISQRWRGWLVCGEEENWKFVVKVSGDPLWTTVVVYAVYVKQQVGIGDVSLRKFMIRTPGAGAGRFIEMAVYEILTKLTYEGWIAEIKVSGVTAL